MAKGASRRQKRCQGERPKPRVASSRSEGMVRSDWYMLKAMFQAWLVKMTKTTASSAPMTWPGKRPRKKVTVKVRKPKIGRDWRMSRMGTITMPARRLLAANVA